MVLDTDLNFQDLAVATNSIGKAALKLQAVLDDEDLLSEYMTTLAGKIRESMAYSIMGVKSGDSKRLAKAEEMLDVAMVEGAKKMNPVIGMFLEASGLDEDLKESPNMLGYLLQALANKGGLMSALSGLDTGSLATPNKGVTKGSYY